MTKIDELTTFLSALELNPTLAKTKTAEVDLKGELNPTLWLNDLFFEQNNWLNFTQFKDYYLQNNEEALRNCFLDTDWEELKKGLEPRLYRTQFGMLTEYHAFYLCKKVFGEENVLRNKDITRIGVDFQIRFFSQRYNIHVFVDSDRAWTYRKFKSQQKQSGKMEGLHVNLPYSMAENRFNSLAILPNGFGVYTQKYHRNDCQRLCLYALKIGEW
jgi:TaqI restriction endonuclease